MRTPSTKVLREVFGDNATEAKRVLQMSRTQLLELPACIARDRECYNPPATYDLRMTALDKLANTCGVEAFQTRNGNWCEYLNSGDTYAATLLRYRGHYRVGCWGDIAERHGTRD